MLGSQIHAGTPQLDGSFAFTQHDLDAHLNGLIHHTFVQPLAGVPQWQAPDGSAVTGKLVTKNATGDGNIAELNLDATQIGTSTGLLAHAVEVLRLNTVGGGAPTGTCDPQATPIVNVSYEADTRSSTASNVERPATPTCARVAVGRSPRWVPLVGRTAFRLRRPVPSEARIIADLEGVDLPRPRAVVGPISVPLCPAAHAIRGQVARLRRHG